MLSKKTLKSIQAFNQEQQPGPSFIAIYILVWFAWHNQFFTSFLQASGGLDIKFTTALSSIEDKQFFIVFLLTCVVFFIRLTFNYLKFKSDELLNEGDGSFESFSNDQIYPKDSDIGKLMATFEKTKQQLVNAKEREKVAVEEKNKAIQKMMATQHELEEAKAEITILTKSLTP